MAKLLESKLSDTNEIKLLWPVEANEIFAVLLKKAINNMQRKSFFYVVDENRCIARWVTLFNTTNEDVDNFIRLIKESLK